MGLIDNAKKEQERDAKAWHYDAIVKRAEDNNAKRKGYEIGMADNNAASDRAYNAGLMDMLNSIAIDEQTAHNRAMAQDARDYTIGEYIEPPIGGSAFVGGQ